MIDRSTNSSFGDVAFGLLGGSLLLCAAAFAIFGIPSLPPAPLVVAGIPSPLSGMTRSFVATMRGDLRSAFALHPLGPLCVAASATALGSLAHLTVRGRRAAVVGRVLAWRPAPWVVTAAFAAAWIRQLVVFT